MHTKKIHESTWQHEPEREETKQVDWGSMYLSKREICLLELCPLKFSNNFFAEKSIVVNNLFMKTVPKIFHALLSTENHSILAIL